MKGEKSNNLSPRGEVVDIFMVILVVLFSVTMTVQLTYLLNSNEALRELGMRALGLLVISIMGISFTAFFRVSMKENLFNKAYLSPSSLRVVPFELFDKRFTADFIKIFPVAFVIQFIITLIFGEVAGFQFNTTQKWEINSVLLVINAGVGEELFFTLFLTGVLLSFKSDKWYILLLCAFNQFIFFVAHLKVYSTNNFALLHLSFLRILYFFVYYKTRRPSIPMLLHCLNNFLSMNTILFPWI